MTKVHTSIRMVWVALASGETLGEVVTVNMMYLPLVPVEDAHHEATSPGHETQTQNIGETEQEQI
jgi:hypothetical protein